MPRFTANTPRPDAAFGSYDYGGFTGIIGAGIAAASEIFQFRNSDPARLIRVNRILVSASVSTTFFAAGVPVQIDLVKSTAWTVQGTGGTAVAAPTGLLKRRTSPMTNSWLTAGDIRIATTAALGAGTKTIETIPMKAIAAAGPITASLYGQILAPGTVLYEQADNDYPLILEPNEGFSIRAAAVPATGTWTLGVNVEWTEVAGYPTV